MIRNNAKQSLHKANKKLQQRRGDLLSSTDFKAKLQRSREKLIVFFFSEKQLNISLSEMVCIFMYILVILQSNLERQLAGWRERREIKLCIPFQCHG